MRKIVNSTKNFTKIDMLNARNGKALRDIDGEMISVKKMAVLEVQEEDDDVKAVGVIVTNDNEVYTCISSGAIAMITDSIVILEEDDLNLSFKVEARLSKNKTEDGEQREFIALTAFV